MRGILSFIVILLTMPLGHAFVVLMEHNLSGPQLFLSAGLLGAGGIALAIAGNKLKSEAMQILCGTFGAILFWGAWVEFIFINYSHSLKVEPLMDGDSVLTKPEYRTMPVSIPFAALSLIMYTYMANTRWGVILLFRKWLHISNESVARNISPSISAFIEMILLIWWAYLLLLVEFDPDLLGHHHPLTLATATICLVAGIILLVRSWRAETWASALRQAIVNVCVLWTFVEIMIKLKLFTEVWIYPEKYIVEMLLIVCAFIVALYLMAKSGHRTLKR